MAAKQTAPVEPKKLNYSPPIKKLVDEHVLIKRWIALIPEVVKNLDVKKVSKKSPSFSIYPSGHKYVGIKLKDDYGLEFEGIKESGTILEHLNKKWDKLC